MGMFEMNTDENSSFDELHERLRRLQEQIESESIKDEEDQKKEVIHLLHDFNQIKDATQVVLGKLANIHGITIKDMHLKYKLPMD